MNTSQAWIEVTAGADIIRPKDNSPRAPHFLNLGIFGYELDTGQFEFIASEHDHKEASQQPWLAILDGLNQFRQRHRKLSHRRARRRART